MRRLVLIGALLVGACAGQAVEPAPTTPPPVVTVPAPTTTAPPSTGDWPSREAYVDDMIDSAESYEALLQAGQATITAMVEGNVSYDDAAALFYQMRDTLDTHIDYFFGTTAPVGFEESHELIQQAWVMTSQAFDLMGRGLQARNIDQLNEAAALMDGAALLVDRATAALPGGTTTGASA